MKNTTTKKDISISIVSYNSFDYLIECLKSIKRYSKGLNIEVLIVDNASNDFRPSGVYDIFPEAIITCNKQNRGFAHAQNQNFKLSNGSLFLLLNPDTLITAGCFQEIFKVFNDHKNVGIVSPTLRLPNVKHYSTHKNLPTINSALRELLFINPVIFFIKRKKSNGIREKAQNYIDVDCINGAAFTVRSDSYRTLNGLDERFFMYFEEMDFCKRIKDILGLKIYVLSNTYVHHLYGKSTINTTTRQTVYYESYVKYFRKHQGIFASIVIRIFILIGEIMRLLIFQVKYFPFSKGWSIYLEKVLISFRLIFWTLGVKSI